MFPIIFLSATDAELGDMFDAAVENGDIAAAELVLEFISLAEQLD